MQIKSGFFDVLMWKTLLKMWIKSLFNVGKLCEKYRKIFKYAKTTGFFEF